MSYVQVCPVKPVSGVCPESLIWQELTHIGLTYPEFLQILPYLVGMLFSALTVRWLVRLIFNSR